MIGLHIKDAELVDRSTVGPSDCPDVHHADLAILFIDLRDDTFRPEIPGEVGINDDDDIAHFHWILIVMPLCSSSKNREVLGDPATPKVVSKALSNSPLLAWDQVFVVKCARRLSGT